MLGKILRMSALISAPLALAGTAAAQSSHYRNPAPADYGTAPAAILLFSGKDFRGDSREVFEPINRLGQIRFNDRTRSIAVLEGAWEVCENANFTGRCVFLRHDEPDMGYFGLNGEITAVRPIYEYTDAEHGLMFNRGRDGYIRYADQHRYGYDDYRYGYGTTRHIDVWHYGYSPAYRQYGYYNPTLGYGPYGFAYNIGRPARYRNYRHRHNDRRHRDSRIGRTDGRVVLYEHGNLRGQTFAVDGAIRDLGRTGFNDRASSIEIRSGIWEVCQHANFRGNCQTVDATGGLRLNDSISSIREVTNRSPQPYMGNNDRYRGQADRDRRRSVTGRNGDVRRDTRRVERDRREVLLGGTDRDRRRVEVDRTADVNRDRRRVHDTQVVDERIARRNVQTGSPTMTGDVPRPNRGNRARVENVTPAPVSRPRRNLPDTPAMRGQSRQAVASPPPAAPRPAPPPRASRPDPRSPAGLAQRTRAGRDRLE